METQKKNKAIEMPERDKRLEAQKKSGGGFGTVSEQVPDKEAKPSDDDGA